MITLLIDGVEVSFKNDVKVIVKLDGTEELHLTLTHEGIVTDAVMDGEVVGSDSRDYGSIADELIG